MRRDVFAPRALRAASSLRRRVVSSRLPIDSLVASSCSTISRRLCAAPSWSRLDARSRSRDSASSLSSARRVALGVDASLASAASASSAATRARTERNSAA